MTVDQQIALIRRFVEPLGFAVEPASFSGSFLPGLRIEAGMRILYDLRELPSAGDILHEAGHLATIPGPFRAGAFGNVDAYLRPLGRRWFAGNRFMTTGADGVPREDPVGRGLLQCGDLEVQAWSYAAALAAGIPLASVFHSVGGAYGGDGSGVRHRLEGRAHAGVHGLAACGMCGVREFPAMLRWLQ